MKALVQFIVGNVLCWGVLGGLVGMTTFGQFAVAPATPTSGSMLTVAEFEERLFLVRVVAVGLALLVSSAFSLGLALHESIRVAQTVGRPDLLWKLCAITAFGAISIAIGTGLAYAVALRGGHNLELPLALMLPCLIGFFMMLPVVRNPDLLKSTPVLSSDLA